MRVVHVYKDIYPPVKGGIERHIDSIRLALPDIQHDVLVCGGQFRTRRQRAPRGRKGIEVLVGEFGRPLSTPIAPTFPLWLRRLLPEAIVHVHMPQPVGELSALLGRRGAPLVASYHADIYRQRALLFLYRPFVIRFLRAADVVITASESLARTSPLLREAAVPMHVVPYGIDVAQWAPENAERALVEQLRHRYGSPHIISVGQLRSYKGFDRLVAAAPQLPCSVVIVGDGRERKSISRQIASLGLERKVHLAGEVNDEALAAHLAAASAFVLPSWNRAEAFGIALLEAQAAGLPVIATDTGTGTTEAFTPGESGISIPPDDRRALVGAIVRLIDNPQLRHRMGEAGTRFVKQSHSLESLAKALGPIYNDLWSSRCATHQATTPPGVRERF